MCVLYFGASWPNNMDDMSCAWNSTHGPSPSVALCVTLTVTVMGTVMGTITVTFSQFLNWIVSIICTIVFFRRLFDNNLRQVSSSTRTQHTHTYMHIYMRDIYIGIGRYIVMDTLSQSDWNLEIVRALAKIYFLLYFV